MTPDERLRWLQDRQAGIGGSDAPAVLGVSKWRTPLDVWHDKRGEAPAFEPTAAMTWGTKLEPLVREEYANQTGRVVRVPDTILRHPDHAFMLGTIDGVTDDGRLVEVKTARSLEGWGEPGTDEIPEAYLVQVQHYLCITKLSVADVAALIGGSDFRIYTVAADPELHDLLIDAEARFWESVSNGHPPDPVTLAEVKQRFRAATARRIEAAPAVLEAVRNLREIRAQIKTLEASDQQLLTAILGYMQDADTLTAGEDVLATWKASKPVSRLDTKALQAAHPDLYQTFLKAGDPVRRFLLKGEKA